LHLYSAAWLKDNYKNVNYEHLNLNRSDLLTSDKQDDTSGHEVPVETLKFHNDRLGALASIGARIGIYHDTRRLAREAMQAIADLLPIKAAILLLMDNSSNTLVFHEAYNLPVEQVERYNRLTNWNDSIEGGVVLRKEPVLIEDVSSDKRAVHYPSGSMSLGLIPLLARDHAIGVLSVTTAAPHKLDQSDMEFLLTLGSQLGGYLENTRLLEELKESNKQLVQQNQDLEELLSVISHDLRSPLAAIGGYASLLIKKGEKVDSEERSRYAEIIFRKTKETSRRFDDLLAVFRSGISKDSGEPVEVDVRAIMEDALEEADPHGNRETFTIKIPEQLPRLWGYPTHLLHLFTNLFSNAIKFIGDREDPMISVDYEKVAPTGEIFHQFSISDNGLGIPADYIADIFRPFTRVPMEEELPGTGVGLASVQRIVRSQGGTVDVESTEGEGTTVTFTLPWEEIE
jgi:signal transduction histidine kinase